MKTCPCCAFAQDTCWRRPAPAHGPSNASGKTFAQRVREVEPLAPEIGRKRCPSSAAASWWRRAVSSPCALDPLGIPVKPSPTELQQAPAEKVLACLCGKWVYFSRWARSLHTRFQFDCLLPATTEILRSNVCSQRSGPVQRAKNTFSFPPTPQNPKGEKSGVSYPQTKEPEKHGDSGKGLPGLSAPAGEPRYGRTL
jgi:hypothetical protein